MHPVRNLPDHWVSVTPERYEELVRNWLSDTGVLLEEFSATLREILSGTDGNYEIDVVVRFKALGVSYLTLVECKHLKRRVEREVVQILHDRVKSLGAHKGILFSTCGFQSGALEYAHKHGIALIQLAEQGAIIHGSSPKADHLTPRPDELFDCIGVLYSQGPEGDERHGLITPFNVDSLKNALGIQCST
jgi:restriction system protein